MFGTRGIGAKLVFSWRVTRACLENKLESDPSKPISVNFLCNIYVRRVEPQMSALIYSKPP